MKANTKLPITFAPTGELNSWTPHIASGNGETTSGARASARFTVNPMDVPRNTTIRKSSRRSGTNAVLRIAPAGSHYARRRFFAPSHTFEHRLP